VLLKLLEKVKAKNCENVSRINSNLSKNQFGYKSFYRIFIFCIHSCSNCWPGDWL